MKIKTYKNGMSIQLAPLNCDGCNVLYINGHKSHEIGCPEAWKDNAIECKECGCNFYPSERYQDCCSENCSEMYHG